MRTGIPAALAAAITLAVAGCGGSGGLSKADLDAKVNAICKTDNAQQSKIVVPDDFATNPVTAGKYLGRLQTQKQSTIAALKKLKPGKAVKDDYDKYLADWDHALSLLASAKTKAQAKDRAGLQVVQQLGNYITSTMKPAERSLGFTVCVNGS